MKKLMLLALAGAVVPMAIAAPSGTAAPKGCSANSSPRMGRLTIKSLKIVNKPIRTRDNECSLSYGPVWDINFPARPGDGQVMVIDAHDVTGVAGYDTHGAHGPFYHLYLVKRGYMVKIRSDGWLRWYRFVGAPKPYRQCDYVLVKGKKGKVRKCYPHNAPIKPIVRHGHKVETLYLRCCWPRYTHDEFLTAKAVLVKSKRVR